MSHHELKKAFDSHKEAVYRFAWRLTHSPAIAEDITQDVFLALMRAPADMTRTPATLRSYLLGITRNLVLRHWRDENRWASLEEDVPNGGEELLITEPLTVDRLDASHAVSTAMAMLPPLQKEALILSAYEGQSLKEISDITKSTITTVKARLFRARENMKRMLAPLQAVDARSAQ